MARKILKFSINPNWDAREHAVFVWAPDNWDDMSPEYRKTFEREEIEQWVRNEIEASVEAFDSIGDVNKHQRKVWGGRSVDSEREIDDWYGTDGIR